MTDNIITAADRDTMFHMIHEFSPTAPVVAAQAPAPNTQPAILPNGTQVTRDEYVQLVGEKNAYARLCQTIDMNNPAWDMIDAMLEEAADLIEEIEETKAFLCNWTFA